MRAAAPLLFAAGCGAVKEYVALAPNGGGPSGGSTKFQWVSVEYPDGVSSADDVSLTAVSSAPSELGAWYGVDPGGVQLTAKIYGDNLYAMINKGSAPNVAGCCADTVRVYPKHGGGNYTDVSPVAALRAALGTDTAWPSHTFDVTTLPDGTVAILHVVRYDEAELGNAPCDAVVAVSAADGSLIKTASGAQGFNIWKAAGTRSYNLTESRYKIQMYYEDSDNAEQWHGNGVQRFTAKSGVTYLAFTHRFAAEFVVFKDPFTYKDGGAIVQRFGTPYGWSAASGATSRRYFGLAASASAFDSGVHNVWYTASSPSLGGAESITMFINDQDGKSQTYEVALAPSSEQTAPGDDSCFQAKYVHAACSFSAQAQGGSRRIGNGVYLVMSGVGNGVGLEANDVGGKQKSIAYSGSTAILYDPFIRVVA